MSAGMPELGSKISLISKADIRYEGRLFTVDPQECTIALANVRSFGTEERETPYPIMPQTTVYDYILFRGSDIKDIRVVNNVAIPNDPAIMQMHLPTQPNFQQNFQQPQQPGGTPIMNQFGLPFTQIQSGNMGPPMGNMPQQQQAQSPIQSHHQDSRSGTPQNTSRKSPTSDLGSQNQNRDNQSGNKDQPQRNIQRSNDHRERHDSGRIDAQDKKRYRNQNQNQNQNQRPNNQVNNQQPQHQQQQQQQQRGYNTNRNNNMSSNNGQNNTQMRGNQGGSARMRGPPNQNYRQQNNQGAPTQNKQNGQQPNRTSKPLKFENEFDFEQANNKFEELRLKLQRLKMGATEEAKCPEQVNGEVEKKDDSGNETGADHEPEADDNSGYDKNKSFFDNISCEAVERSKGKNQRTDWRAERKLNSETFGYSFNRRGGNYRGGRGGYYPRQYNGPRPTYRGNQNGYRPMRNHRNQNNVEGRNNTEKIQGNDHQSQNQPSPVAVN